MYVHYCTFIYRVDLQKRNRIFLKSCATNPPEIEKGCVNYKFQNNKIGWLYGKKITILYDFKYIKYQN